jgi:hypothetical protein
MKNAEPVDTALAAAKDADGRDIVIVKAEYGDAGGNYDVTELVRSHVKGGSPTFKVGADMFGWPGQWGRVMRTTLNYKGKRLFLVNAEGDMFDASVEALEKAYAYSTGADAIRIVKAEYGGGIKWTDVSAKIAELLKSGTFKFTPSRMLLAPDLGQPLGGEDHKVLKLTVHYKARTTLFIAEELTEVNLSLEAIDTACDKTERCRGIEIIQADFGAGDWRVDVTSAVSEWFKDGASGFKISSPLFGDPAPRLSKVFRIKYKLNGNSYEKEIREGGILELP